MSVHEPRCESAVLGHIKQESQFAYEQRGLLVVARVCQQTHAFCEEVAKRGGEPMPGNADVLIVTCALDDASLLWLEFTGSIDGYPGDEFIFGWNRAARHHGNNVVALWAYVWWNQQRGCLIYTQGVGFAIQAGIEAAGMN